MNFSTWSISDYAAWWGAITATLALAWNIVVAVRSGPRIHVSAAPNMQIVPRNHITGDKTYILVTAINRGNAPTTITHFGGFYSDNIWDLVRKKRRPFIIPPHPAFGKDVPYVLAPGEQWSNMADEADIKEKFGNGYFFIGVFHNQRKRPVFVRVRLNP